MEITYLGFIFIPVGFGLLAISESWLFFTAIFFIPFSASALINFTSGFWLSPFHFFGGLWLLRYISTLLFFKYKPQYSDYLFGIFYFVVILSQTMPIFIDGDLFIKDTLLLENGGALFFSSRNITVPLYLLFGLIFALLLSIRNLNFYFLRRTLRVYVLSAFFVSVFGIFQFVCNFTGSEYPYFIFNNSHNPVAQGFSQILPGINREYTRISSVASEPSVLAQFLIPVLPIVLIALLSKQYIFTKAWDFFVLILIFLTLILSTSGTAYFGLLLFYFLTPIIARNYLKDIRRLLDSIMIFNIFFILLTLKFFSSFYNDFLFNKFFLGSGVERLMTIKYSFSYFMDYPILGIGWGSASSNDMFVNVLVSSGFVGFSIFLLILIHITASLFRALNRFYHIQRVPPVEFVGPYCVAILISFVLTLAVNEISGFNYGYGNFWISVGLAIAASSCLRQLMLK